MPRVVVTRPAPQAQQWAEALRTRGLDALALPLIETAALADPAPLRAAWQALDQHQALVFVSGAAVRHFFESNEPETLARWTSGAIKTRAWSPGPGTVQALRAHGLPAALIDQPAADARQFDSEALWAVVRPQARLGARVLRVRGGDARGQGRGRDWLAERLAEAGAEVHDVVAYQRRAPPWGEAERAQARAAAAPGTLWLFSSSEAVAHLRALLPGQDWSGARALATHPRIEEAARAAGFGVVYASRPALAEVVASIESAQ